VSSPHGPWDVLGIEPTGDTREIRRAYARKLKLIQPEDDPEGFQALRNAYEWALHLAVAGDLAAGSGNEPEAEPVAVSEAEPAPAPDPEPRTQVDADALQLEQALRTLASLLHDPGELDVSRAMQQMQMATAPDLMARLDLLHHAEHAVGYLLATTIPRSDTLLPEADRVFEWDKRRAERDLPDVAQAVLARLDDLAMLRRLCTGSDADAKAFERLRRPARPLMRMARSLMHVSVWPELDLLAKLEWRHPRLLADLPAENVEWWRSFSRRPHFSWVSFGIGAITGWLLHLIHGDASRPGMLLWLVPLAGLCAALLRLFVVDWPVLEIQRRWAGRAPPWLELGWLPAGILLACLAVPAAGVTWLAWTCAALSMLVALWAALVAGPSPSIFTDRQILVMNSRMVRAVILNVFVMAWLGMMASEQEWIFTAPFVSTLAGALLASAFGRELQIRAQREWVPERTQVGLCVLLIGVAAGLCWLLFRLRADSQWHATLVVSVLALLVARRSMPFEIPGLELPRFAVYGVIVLVSIGRGLLEDLVSFRTNDGAQSGGLVIGGCAMLAGVAISAGSWIYRLRSQR